MVFASEVSENFRDYEKAKDSVVQFYKRNHHMQTLQLVLEKKRQYCVDLNRKQASIWNMMRRLDEIIDESDPDTEMSQIQHALQSAEAARKNGEPRWLILVTLIHDLGKVLSLWGETSELVVGDTFPVGCGFSPEIVFSEFFKDNPDSKVSKYQTELGIYTANCGLENVHMSFGHDEYLYHVCKNYLPKEALYVIRYHSFYACHSRGEYQHLMTDEDHKMMEWVKKFNPYDLYSKHDELIDFDSVKLFYEELVKEFFPSVIEW